MSLVDTNQVPIGSLSNLCHHLKQREWIKTQFKNPENLFKIIDEKATIKQYNYIRFLLIKNKSGKIREILLNLGLEPN